MKARSQPARHGDAPLTGSARLLAALRFAAEQHRDHRRKGEIGAPYINHPITVAEQLADAGLGDQTDLLMAAVLHDVIEDTETTEAELARAFGPVVTRIVMEVTDDKALKSSERKTVAIEKLPQKSREAQLLKLSDLLANVTDLLEHPPNWPMERKTRYLDWAQAVAGSVAGVHPVLEGHLTQAIAKVRAALAE